MTRLALWFTLGSTVTVAACGAGTGARSPGDERAQSDDSIGALAAAQGGLSSLGHRDPSAAGAAMTGPLRIESVVKRPKLDGVLGEWHARSPAREGLTGKTDALGLRVAVQADQEMLFVAAEIEDDDLVRSAKHRPGDDHVTLTIAFPSGRGALKAYEIGLWPGAPGSHAGAVKWTAGPKAGRAVPGAKLVEYDAAGGVTLEAMIPWSSFPEATTVRVGLRAAFRYHDGDGSRTTGVLGTGAGAVDRPSELDALPTAAEHAVVEGLLAPKGLSATRPDHDVYADLAGDGRKERVSVFGRFFTICGPGYRDGEQFFWRELPGDVVSVEARSLTGRAKDDLVVRRQMTQGTATHELLEVWSLASSDEPTTVFAQQIAIASGDGAKRVSNAARLSPKQIEVKTEPATGWDASSFGETVFGAPGAAASDIEPILLPWGAVQSRTYKLDGGRFVRASEVARAGATGALAKRPAEPALPRDVPTPPVKRAPADLGKRVLDAYMTDAGLPKGTKARFDLSVHVDGDPQPERVLLFGRDIVVLGPAFRGGTGYARMSLTQFADEADVRELTARDLDGDGAAEIIVRGARRASGPAGEAVMIDGLFVYRVKDANVARVFSIETGREMSGKRVQGLVQFVPSTRGRGFDIDARPGIAKGWTSATYPWAQEPPGSGPIEPLLLPWGNVPSVRYVWNGSSFTAAP